MSGMSTLPLSPMLKNSQSVISLLPSSWSASAANFPESLCCWQAQAALSFCPRPARPAFSHLRHISHLPLLHYSHSCSPGIRLVSPGFSTSAPSLIQLSHLQLLSFHISLSLFWIIFFSIEDSKYPTPTRVHQSQGESPSWKRQERNLWKLGWRLVVPFCKWQDWERINTPVNRLGEPLHWYWDLVNEKKSPF